MSQALGSSGRLPTQVVGCVAEARYFPGHRVPMSLFDIACQPILHILDVNLHDIGAAPHKVQPPKSWPLRTGLSFKRISRKKKANILFEDSIANATATKPRCAA